MPALQTEQFITGLVLGAGGSARLGRPEQLLPYGDGTLLGHALAVARACPFDQIVVALGGGRRRRARHRRPDGRGRGRQRCLRFGLFLLDRRGADRPRPSLRRAGAAARRPARRHARRGDDADRRTRRRPPRDLPLRRWARTPDRVREANVPELAGLHGDKGVWRLLDRHGDDVSEVPIPGTIPRDVDTQEDYEAVLAVTRAGR